MTIRSLEKMFGVTCLTVMIVYFVRDGVTISAKSDQNKTAELLWNLSNLAIQSRQNGYFQRPTYFPNKNYHDLNDKKQYFPVYAKPYPYKQFASGPIENGLYSNQASDYHRPNFNLRETFLDILHSVASNDDLQCVPKIICEITSGAIAGRQSGLNLPVNINMDSVVGFLSGLNGIQSSPLLYFGKAALLGYSAKGNTRSCTYAYPECPSDPDRLVQYLNNHNGGFFRYFNGIRPIKNHNYAPYYPQYNQNYHPYSKTPLAESRIQNHPTLYIPISDEYQKVTFPVDPKVYNQHRQPNSLSFPPSKDYFTIYKTQNGLKFPEDTYDESYAHSDPPFRKPKELPVDLSFYHQNEILDLQKPLPNHHATPDIFPVRTGTGELRFDDEELNKEVGIYQDDNVNVKLQEFNDGYHINYGDFSDYNRKGKEFLSFPS